MTLGTRNSLLGYVSALRDQAGEPDESGIPTTCPIGLAKGLHESAQRWESICRKAAGLLSTYQFTVGGEDPGEMLAEAEEAACNIAAELAGRGGHVAPRQQ